MHALTAGAFLAATIAYLALTYLGSKYVQPRGLMLDPKSAVIARRNRVIFLAALAMTAVSGLCVGVVVVGSKLSPAIEAGLPLLLVGAAALLTGAAAGVVLQRRSLRA